MNLFDLSKKTAVITGAASGLGKRAAQILSKAGARVIQLDKQPLSENILPNSLAILVDVSNESEVQAVFESFEKKGEKVDILFCAAGIGGLTPIFEQESSKQFQNILQTNLMGTWYVVHAAAKHMKASGIAGSIITIASVRGVNYLGKKISAYCVSKAAVIQLTKALAEELAQVNIRINAIAPGLFRTSLTEYKFKTPVMEQAMIQTIPLGFVANPEHLDGATLYLASNKASAYVTGACLTVDGGESLREIQA